MNPYFSVTTDDVTPQPLTPAPAPRSRHGPAVRLAGQVGWPGLGYEGAAVNRLNRHWATAHMAADVAIGASWDNLTRRARDLKRNEPWAQQAVERIVQNVIGDEGFRAESEIEIDGEIDEDANREIDEWCERWAEEADAEGKLHLAELQQLAMSETAEVGQCFLVAVNLPDRDRAIPLAYQLIEAEQLNTYLDWPVTSMGGPLPEGLLPGNRIRRGIEFDRFHRVVAYHFWAEHPYDFQISNQKTIRVPASRVIHQFRRGRPSQTQGITWFAPILQALRDLSQYIGDEMTAASIGAKFVVAIKRAVGAGSGLGFNGDGDVIDADGNPLEELGAGIIADLAAGDEIEQIESKRPNSGSEPWIKLILESMANGVGMTYLGLTGDVSKATFSSARFARIQDKTFWRTLQGHFGRTVVLPMRRAAVKQMSAMGLFNQITPTQFAAQPARWLATRLLPHGWEEIQVGEEVDAAIKRIQAGFSTLQIECANFGRNWRRILKQRYRELQYADGLDLDLSTNYPGVPPQPSGQAQPDTAAAEGADEDADAEEAAEEMDA